MNIFLQKALRLWVILIAFLLGIVIVYYFVKPKILEPLGMVNTNRCLKIIYKTVGNTALVYVDPINRWFWYNDKKVFVYGDFGGRYCQNTDEYEPAYVLDVSKEASYPGQGIGYECVKKLSLVKDFYENNEAKWGVVLHCLDFSKDLSSQILTTQQIVNILLRKRIIFD